jgi:hypothetical protein
LNIWLTHLAILEVIVCKQLWKWTHFCLFPHQHRKHYF